MAAPQIPPGFDFTDPDIYAERLPVEELAELRRAAPIWWNAQPPDKGGFGDGGFWVVSKHRDVREVSLRSDVFSSAAKSVVPRYKVTGGGGQIEAGRASMIMMDDPEHSRLRKIVSRGFTPRAVARLRAELDERARRIAAEAAAADCGDFVLQVARELPLQAIAGLLGVPEEDREKLFDWSNRMIGDDDPEFAEYDALGSAGEMMWYAMQLAARKAGAEGSRPQHGDQDIVTTLMDADADGQLTEAEFGMFVVTLAIAGNETSRNSITQGMMAFTEFPDQWELFKAQRPKTAADEIIRWASPITAFQRTALADTELGGVQIKKGQRVVLFYRSANFDEDVFDDPFTFNILRSPNPHLAFGGTGAHYCIGANLARMTIDLMFNAIADHIPALTPVGKPERLRSSFINGIKHWQVEYH
ncbi:steroid C27-monooxygenase [Mycobacterium intermedium]|uniref:Steroid C27-monooxygenase n=1 Tax=Mycobacterium intermedium TaxID=28445 RepID=A0A1E3S507_MYCIE|nr:cytochrome P450 [Mycobacterium intermedium]MCV6966913.1 cytochrome P450 [Mycobacterium intermedium]ODQ97255.1 steroid C27-monooxygenase [Mycobacterium intermedium]OPE47420.1 steroid C27-monooxygenase [Mycobacterium intermedium]ORA96449.1 steroid C27-monooxygenase [Mycobacterium intermedium]